MVVLAIHDLNLVSRYADHIALLVDGRIQADGSPAEVLQPEILSTAYQLEMKIFHPEGSIFPIILPRET